ncbi:MAG: HNH endonuclease [Alistipes sp.]|nr:HNH endonuclease [Alistipes sp.]
MKTFLFAHNPQNWHWKNLNRAIADIEETGSHFEKWSVRSYRQVSVGDRAFLMRLGKNTINKGIIGSGYIHTGPFLSEHWSENGKMVQRVIIEFDTLSKDPIVSLDELKSLPYYNWTPQSSGQIIHENIATALEEMWLEKTTRQIERIITHPALKEGAVNTILSKRYERNPLARSLCLRANGYSCKICGFNFKETYGELGENYIHVHHIVPMSAIGQEYRVSPETDLIPICANCHAMVHRKTPPYEPGELISRLHFQSQ